MSKRKILFLGETFRADAQTWINGLKEFGNFEVVTWEMNETGKGWRRLLRLAEFMLFAPSRVRRKVREEQPDMVIAERTTSFGFLAAVSGAKPIAIAQQGITDIYPPGSWLTGLKKALQAKAFQHANLIHAWGPVMANSMKNVGVDMHKVMVRPKGIDLRLFTYTAWFEKCLHPIRLIVTRSLGVDYRHEVIIKAAAHLDAMGIPIQLTIVGDGPLRARLEHLSKQLHLAHCVAFTGSVPNQQLPVLLKQSAFYLSMPVSEGVSSSLFEAMACGCYPIVTDLPGNRSWIRDGENGRLIPVDDDKKLAAAIYEAVQIPDNIASACKLNRIFVEEHASFEANMQVIADRYHQLIDERQQVTPFHPITH
jgi:glycosyltransferase involved in cell wall biosynthesis